MLKVVVDGYGGWERRYCKRCLVYASRKGPGWAKCAKLQSNPERDLFQMVSADVLQIPPSCDWKNIPKFSMIRKQLNLSWRSGIVSHGSFFVLKLDHWQNYRLLINKHICSRHTTTIFCVIHGIEKHSSHSYTLERWECSRTNIFLYGPKLCKLCNWGKE